MDDLISRQAAIDAIEKYFAELPIRVHADMLAIIHGLPSAQPVRKKGKWFEVDPYMVICPFCKHASSRRNFCAECGADMRGETNE